MKPFRPSILLLCALSAITLPSLAVALQPPPGGGYPNEVTALGDEALGGVTIPPAYDTAVGYNALHIDIGGENTALGANTLANNTEEGGNGAAGVDALLSNTSGNSNVAIGLSAMVSNTTGHDSVAIGSTALETATTAYANVACGFGGYAGLHFAGNNNVAVGYLAGQTVATGANNIEIGSQGAAHDDSIIRLGDTAIQKKTFIAGISNATVSGGITVMVTTKGQLGVATSSARYKDNIQPMAKSSEAILSLQPVTFRYKKELDPEAIPQFGLVAEEVANVDPDLVARDEEGKPYTVRYEAVNAMLLNEFLKEHRKVESLETTVAQQRDDFRSALARQEDLRSTVAQQQKQIDALTSQIQKVSDQLGAAKPAPRIVVNN